MLKINRNTNFDQSSICQILHTSMNDYFDLRHDLNSYELDNAMFIIKDD